MALTRSKTRRTRDITATLYWALGIDPKGEVYNGQARPCRSPWAIPFNHFWLIDYACRITDIRLAGMHSMRFLIASTILGAAHCFGLFFHVSKSKYSGREIKISF